MDAHSKAKTLHRDLSLGNIILYMVPGQATRAGYLIDWELSCKIDKMTVRDHVLTVSSYPFRGSSPNEFLKGTPAFVSIATSYQGTDHIHCLKDDLEPTPYVVLYCALLWLPVTSHRTLDWWLIHFFHISHEPGGGAPCKRLNAMSREYTRTLKSTQSQAILDWLNATMDLHYHVEGGPNPGGLNPAWADGKALEDMWKKVLDKKDLLPENDRQRNPVPNIVRRKEEPLPATYSTGTMSKKLFPRRFVTLPPSTIATTSVVQSGPRSVPPPPLFPVTPKRTAFESFGTVGVELLN